MLSIMLQKNTINLIMPNKKSKKIDRTSIFWYFVLLGVLLRVFQGVRLQGMGDKVFFSYFLMEKVNSYGVCFLSTLLRD